MTELVVEIQNLSRQFGSTLALDDINFRAHKGQVYGLVGANGAGKTTLIKHMLGLYRAKSGSVRVFSLDPVQQPVEVLKNIGYLSEDRDIPEWMSIKELMNYTQAYHRNWDSKYATGLLHNFALDPGKKIKQLSRGMRAQVALISAVAHRPELLILDEPSSGLDAVVRKDILNAIVRTISEDGRTVIFSSHFLEEVERMSDQVTMIHQGRIALEGSLETLTSSHHCTSIRFTDPALAKPALEDVLSIAGAGRYWSVIHRSSVEKLGAALSRRGGEIVESRNASLEEIFVARVGRVNDEAITA